MKLYFGGVRGGQPVPDPAFQQIGGDTTSFLVSGHQGEAVIVDAGTGLRNVYSQLSRTLPDTRTALLCCSHFHLDHLAGLPTFPALYDEAWSLELVARVIGDLTMEDIVSAFVHPPLWPLALDELGAGKRFRILDDESMQAASIYGSLELRWCPLHHPGGSTAFRIDEPASGQSVVIATDLEWSESEEAERQWLRQLCAEPTPASVLVFDGKYAPGDYDAHRGWGHSTWQEGIDLARHCGVGALWLTHHDPAMDDEAALTREDEVQAVWASARLARQGVELDVGAVADS